RTLRCTLYGLLSTVPSGMGHLEATVGALGGEKSIYKSGRAPYREGDDILPFVGVVVTIVHPNALHPSSIPIILKASSGRVIQQSGFALPAGPWRRPALSAGAEAPA